MISLIENSRKYILICSNKWRRRWHPTPVLLPDKSHGWRSLVGCSPWGRQESDMTERLHFHFSFSCIGEGNGNPLQCSCLEKESQGRGSLVGCHLWGCTESDMTEATQQQQQQYVRISFLRKRIKLLHFAPPTAKKGAHAYLISLNFGGNVFLFWGCCSSSFTR